ncbi:MAG: hypothetical protein HQL40_11930 [Alphaproteobacteria bacterium]|nr:hypothetical protein [Alphaproteobacteria bacterium]
MSAFKRWWVGKPETATLVDPGRMCRPATWEDVLMVTGLLEAHDVRYALCGGYALFANGLVRQTGDVDVLVENSKRNNARWIAAMAEMPDHAAVVLVGEVDPFTDAGPYSYDDQPGVIRIADVIVVDIMPKACGLTYEMLQENIARLDIDGHGGLNVLDIYGLWLTKQGCRDKDKADRVQLEHALTRLRAWPENHEARMLSLATIFSERATPFD